MTRTIITRRAGTASIGNISREQTPPTERGHGSQRGSVFNCANCTMATGTDGELLPLPGRPRRTRRPPPSAQRQIRIRRHPPSRATGSRLTISSTGPAVDRTGPHSCWTGTTAPIPTRWLGAIAGVAPPRRWIFGRQSPTQILPWARVTPIRSKDSTCLDAHIHAKRGTGISCPGPGTTL